MVESALARRDKVAAIQYLIDWDLVRAKHTRISKFEPGDHYYVLDTKFDTMEEAVEHARQHGFFSTSFHRVPIPRSGD